MKRLQRPRLLKFCRTTPPGVTWFNCEIEEENDAYSDSVIRVMDGNEQIITICAVGLNDENQIVITDADDDFTWFTPDEWTHAYLDMYEFVVNNLKFAKMKP